MSAYESANSLNAGFPTNLSRPHAAAVQVVGVGLGRTGTLSLSEAFEILGFGPTYHPLKSPTMDKDYFTWADIIEGKDTSLATFDKLLQGYRSVTDAPVGAVTKEIYAAYPNAKYILTVRDPVKWEVSMKATILEALDRLSEFQNLPSRQGLYRWFTTYQNVYHKGRLTTHAAEEFVAHIERVKSIIPADQLLVYTVGEGWERLAGFLGVPVPNVPFPHLNDSVMFTQKLEERVREMEARRATEIV